nr:hypothetical protein [Actinomycetota bacterium]
MEVVAPRHGGCAVPLGDSEGVAALAVWRVVGLVADDRRLDAGIRGSGRSADTWAARGRIAIATDVDQAAGPVSVVSIGDVGVAGFYVAGFYVAGFYVVRFGVVDFVGLDLGVVVPKVMGILSNSGLAAPVGAGAGSWLPAQPTAPSRGDDTPGPGPCGSVVA